MSYSYILLAIALTTLGNALMWFFREELLSMLLTLVIVGLMFRNLCQTTIAKACNEWLGTTFNYWMDM